MKMSRTGKLVAIVLVLAGVIVVAGTTLVMTEGVRAPSDAALAASPSPAAKLNGNQRACADARAAIAQFHPTQETKADELRVLADVHQGLGAAGRNASGDVQTAINIMDDGFGQVRRATLTNADMATLKSAVDAAGHGIDALTNACATA